MLRKHECRAKHGDVFRYVVCQVLSNVEAKSSNLLCLFGIIAQYLQFLKRTMPKLQQTPLLSPAARGSLRAFAIALPLWLSGGLASRMSCNNHENCGWSAIFSRSGEISQVGIWKYRRGKGYSSRIEKTAPFSQCMKDLFYRRQSRS